MYPHSKKNNNYQNDLHTNENNLIICIEKNSHKQKKKIDLENNKKSISKFVMENTHSNMAGVSGTQKKNFKKIDLDFDGRGGGKENNMEETKQKSSLTLTKQDGSVVELKMRKRTKKTLVIKPKATHKENKKIDLKISQDNIPTMEQKATQNHKQIKKFDLVEVEQPQAKTKMNEIFTTEKLGYKFYHTKKSSKECKKMKIEYKSPLTRASEDMCCGSILIKKDELSKQGKTWVSYGAMDIEELEKIWKTDNHLYEIIEGDTLRKLYFDVDDRFVSQDDNYEKLKLLNELIGIICDVNIETTTINGFMCYGEGMKSNGNTEYKKSSYHFIIGDYYFENQASQKKAMNFIQHLVLTEDKFEPLRNGVLDFNVYSKNQAFKLPYQTKVMKGGIKQLPQDEDDKLTDYLISGEFVLSAEAKEIDVSKFGDFDVKKKQVKLATGKSVLVDFNEGFVLNGLKSAFPKGFKHNVDGPRGNDLNYYLKSIPNNENVPKVVWKTIGYCIRNIEKDLEKGLKKWCEWTKPYKEVCCDDLREEYSKHTSGKGYGWKMLYNMACVFNKKMVGNSSSNYQELFDEEPTFPCVREKQNQKYIDKDYFKKKLNDFDNLIVKSPMGSGKSYTLKQVFMELNSQLGKKYKSILYFSCKRAFACSMSKDFEAYGFKNYMDINDFDFTSEDRIICSVESIHKCRMAYDLVIIDESESIADNLTGKMFIKNKCVEGASKMYDIIKNSKKVMVMDAYITTRTHNMLKEIKGNLNETNTLYLQNGFINERRTFVDCDKTMLYFNLRRKLIEGKRCVVVCGSSGYATFMKNELSKLKKENGEKYDIILYNSKQPLEPKTDVNEVWKDCDLLIYTPTITAGISYDPILNGKKDISKHFDSLFIYCVNVGSSHFRDTIQAHRRIRDFLSNTIYICINDNFRGHNIEQLPTRKCEVLEMEEKFKSRLFGDECISLNDREELKWIYNIHIHNILERNVSQIHMRGFATEYLKRENIYKKVESNTEIKLVMEEDEWNFDGINSISSQLYCEYRERMSSQDMDEKLTDEEFAEWYKFKYSHMLSKNIDKPMKEYFNRYLVNPQHRGFVNSVVEYKRMIDEIGCDYSRIKEYSTKKYYDENIPMEYYDMKYKRYEHIMKIMNGIGLFADGVMNINKEIYGDDFKVLCEEYSKIPIKTLNSMLTKNYITTKKKTETEIIKPRTLQGIFNQLINEEFGVELHGTGKYKYIKVDGKKKKLTILGIRNADVDEEDEEDCKFYNSEYLIFNLIKDKIELEEVPYIEGEFTETKNDAFSSEEEEGDCCVYDDEVDELDW